MNGRRDIPIPMSEATFNEIATNLSLPSSFVDLIGEETTRCSRSTIFDKDDQERGTGEPFYLVSTVKLTRYQYLLQSTFPGG
jgi:hypothetical protein